MEVKKTFSTASTISSFYIHEGFRYFLLDGKDQLDFLQRQTTNDLRQLTAGRTVLTVLTDPSARILDVLKVFKPSFLNLEKGEDGLVILTLPKQGESTIKFLKSRIFFMDQVTLTDLSDDNILVELFGLQIESKLNKLGFEALPGEGEISTISAGGIGFLQLSRSDAIGLGYSMIVPNRIWEALHQKLIDMGFEKITSENYEMLRIENGLPAAGHELVEKFTPLEVGLDKVVSGSKGCYTGQEVLARQMTYDKVTKKLCGVRFNKSGNHLVKLWMDSKLIGEITSSVNSSQFGPIGLAVVRKPFYLPGTKVHAGQDLTNLIDAEIVELPFS